MRAAWGKRAGAAVLTAAMVPALAGMGAGVAGAAAGAGAAGVVTGSEQRRVPEGQLTDNGTVDNLAPRQQGEEPIEVDHEVQESVARTAGHQSAASSGTSEQHAGTSAASQAQGEQIPAHVDHDEWRDDSGHWFRSFGNENWEFDAQGLMRLRIASINDLPISADERLFEVCTLVTEMTKIKHPMDAGRKGQRGIEW